MKMQMKIAALTLGFAAAAAVSIPAQAAGFGTFYAALNGNGAVVTSSGVGSSARKGVGKYEVTFNRPIGGCAPLVTVNGALPGYGVVKKKIGTNNVLQIGIFNKTGVGADLPTTVFVMCNPGD